MRANKKFEEKQEKKVLVAGHKDAVNIILGAHLRERGYKIIFLNKKELIDLRKNLEQKLKERPDYIIVTSYEDIKTVAETAFQLGNAQEKIAIYTARARKEGLEEEKLRRLRRGYAKISF